MPFDRESNQLKYKGYVIDLNDPFASEKAREILELEKAQIRRRKKSGRENITLARKIADDNLKNLKELNETLATVGKDLVDLKQKRKQLHQQALDKEKSSVSFMRGWIDYGLKPRNCTSSERCMTCSGVLESITASKSCD